MNIRTYLSAGTLVFTITSPFFTSCAGIKEEPPQQTPLEVILTMPLPEEMPTTDKLYNQYILGTDRASTQVFIDKMASGYFRRQRAREYGRLLGVISAPEDWTPEQVAEEYFKVYGGEDDNASYHVEPHYDDETKEFRFFSLHYEGSKE